MNIEQKRTWMKRYRKSKDYLDHLTMKLDNLNERIYKAKTPDYSGIPKSTRPKGIEELLYDKEKLEERIDNQRKICRTYKDEIWTVIDSLEDWRLMEVLEQSFIDGKTLDNIAEELGYNRRHISRLQADALEQIHIPTIEQ